METDTVMVTLCDAEAEYPPLDDFEAEVRGRSDDTLSLVASTDGLNSARGLLHRLLESAIYPSVKVKLRDGARVWAAQVVPDGPNHLGPYTTRDGKIRCTVTFAGRLAELQEA